MEELPAVEYGDHLEPPFWGTSNLLSWSAENVFQSIKKSELFKNEWARVNSSSNSSPESASDFETLYTQFQQEVIGAELIQAFGIYGFFPVITDNEQLIIIDPSDFHTELMTLHLPRSERLNGRSVCDFFRPSGDSIAIQAGTLGNNIQLRWQSYLNSQTSEKGRYLQTLAEHCTKIITEKLATEIRRCLGLERGVGVVYDVTGPAIPQSDSIKKIFELLSLEERLGIELTERYVITPLHSAVGIFVHHPEAVLKRMEPS
jgi:5-methyltetrahydrofolate--homocysteine methyltransferase